MSLQLTDDDKEIIRIAEKINEQSKIIKFCQFLGHNYVLVSSLGLVVGGGCAIVIFGSSKNYSLISTLIVFFVMSFVQVCRTYCDWIVIKKLSLKIKSLEVSRSAN